MSHPRRTLVPLALLALLGCSQGEGDLVLSQMVVPGCFDQPTEKTFSLEIMGIMFKGDSVVLRPHDGNGSFYATDGLTLQILDRNRLTEGPHDLPSLFNSPLPCCSEECGPCDEGLVCVPGDAAIPRVCSPNLELSLELYNSCPDSPNVFMLTGTIDFQRVGLAEGEQFSAVFTDLQVVPTNTTSERGASGTVSGSFDFEVRFGPPYQPFSGDR